MSGSRGRCLSCQEIRGTWQGVLGTCVYQDIDTVVDFNRQQNRDNAPKTATRCVPTVVDPTLLVFDEASGKMATGVSPSSAPANGGQFAFDFTYNRNEELGNVDMFISTFLGSRTLFGKFQVQASELGSILFLALGATRASTAAPQRTSALLREEIEHVYFEGFRIADFSPAVETYAAQRLPAGSCRHVAVPGDDMDSIARQYLLTWQEIYAFNAHLYNPQAIKPGDLLAVGRHHVVKGPCVNFEERQSGPQVTDVVKDATCTCTSQVACRAAEGIQLGETLFGIATRLGTSWQRVVDMNPHLQACTADSCAVLPGDSLCVVPYLRNVMCEAEYRRFPVVDANGNSPGYLNTYFSCDPKWSAKLTVEKCCQVPRCKCCTKDKYVGVGTSYATFQDAPTANTCDVTAVPHQKCLQDPFVTDADGVQAYSLLCDDDCQLLCDKEDPTTPDPKCPTSVGLTVYTGLCVPKRLLNGITQKVCT
jgi:hypothetical protein